MKFVYYVGGPWDLHKVARTSAPREREIMREVVTRDDAGPMDPVEYLDHQYALKLIAPDLFVAVHESHWR